MDTKNVFTAIFLLNIHYLVYKLYLFKMVTLLGLFSLKLKIQSLFKNA